VRWSSAAAQIVLECGFQSISDERMLDVSPNAGDRHRYKPTRVVYSEQTSRGNRVNPRCAAAVQYLVDRGHDGTVGRLTGEPHVHTLHEVRALVNL
jgi:hypothetical protein